MSGTPNDGLQARAQGSGQAAIAIFALGMMSGMLVLMIAFLLFPEPEDPATAEFEAVQDFARRHFVREVGSEELVTRALSGMLDGLDPYSRYYDEVSSEQARREIDGDFRGIGVVFRSPDGQTWEEVPPPGTQENPRYHNGIPLDPPWGTAGHPWGGSWRGHEIGQNC